MSPDSPPALLPAPTVTDWRNRLAEASTVELMPFTRRELASVGAGSPVRGLVADESFLALGDEEVDVVLRHAREGLAARGLAGPPAVSPEDPSRIRIPLGGDLAAIVAVRRAPALVATVGAGPPELVRRPGGDPGASTVLAVLHGVTGGADGGVLALLEETATGRGLHLFALSTPAAQAGRIRDAWRQLEEEAPTAVSVHVFIPDSIAPRHIQLALQSGVARVSSDGQTWQRSEPDYAWPDLFQAAVTL